MQNDIYRALHRYCMKQRYLKDGPMPIPDSFLKNGLCRYNYPTDALPPPGIGKKTIDRAITNLGVQRVPTGPRGGMRWHLPQAGNAHPDPSSPGPDAGKADEKQQNNSGQETSMDHPKAGGMPEGPQS